MATLFLLRHGRSTSNTAGTLAGRTRGVHLDDHGRAQAERAAEALKAVKFDALISSPLERCQETIAFAAAGRRRKVRLEESLIEAGYGSWSGQKIKDLAKDPLWKVVQSHPSAVTFPGRGGESMLGMQQRAVGAVRHWNARVGDNGVWLACSHGDVIKSIVADALGMHLDQFQRINVDPASVTVIRYTELRPFVLTLNATNESLASFIANPSGQHGKKLSSDAVVGGGTGSRKGGRSGAAQAVHLRST